MSVHPGARDVLTWAVERVRYGDGSDRSDWSCDASGHTANAGRSAVHSADDPRGGRVVRHPCGLWIRRRTGSLAALAQALGPLTTGRARLLLREILSPGCAKLGALQGAVEWLEDLIRRFTQRRDALNGQRHTLAEDIRMAALEALLPEELERHCQPRRSRLDTNQKQREEVVFEAGARGYVAPKLGQVGVFFLRFCFPFVCVFVICS